MQLTVAAFTLCALAAPAIAEEDWYGDHVLATDGLSSATGLSGALLDVPAMAYIGLGGMVLGGPAVHAAHGNYGRMGISLAMRAGLITGGFIAGAASSDSPKGGDVSGVTGAFGDAYTAALIGYVLASVIDIAFVAREDDDDGATARMLSIGGRF